MQSVSGVALRASCLLLTQPGGDGDVPNAIKHEQIISNDPLLKWNRNV